jgi:DNA repair protein RadC
MFLGATVDLPDRKSPNCASTRIKGGKYSNLLVDVCTSPLAKGRRVSIVNSDTAVEVALEVTPLDLKVAEHVLVLALDSRNQVLAAYLAAKGGLDASLVDVRVILQFVLLVGGSGFIVFHNHPSGSADPSADDITITQALARAAKTVHLRMLDHIVIGNTTQAGITKYEYVSLREKGHL